MNLLGALYGALARRRRARFATPGARRRLDQAVISVGGLTVGGSGKTPVVAALARLLQAGGERPVILSRGYARRYPSDGVVVASDAAGVLAPTAKSGDEPQMLARQLPGIPVLVCPDRFLAGRLAERRFGATVHLLDDGFQHLALARDLDVVVVSADDLDGELLPLGRLREPIDTARVADALVVPGGMDEAGVVGACLGAAQVFTARAAYEPLALAQPFGTRAPCPDGARVLAFAGIARPSRFFDALGACGYEVMASRRFRDHHAYSRWDLSALATAARTAGADALVTTEKDAVRIEQGALDDVPLLYLPYRMRLEPAAAFADWLGGRLDAVRSEGIVGAA